jgi:mRNA-degrading endonuclease YafQ of YafQ-DinJ toxin-antitoxin module
MLDIHFTKQMHQGIKRMAKRGKDLGKLEELIKPFRQGLFT